jgi:hypothetical protein
VLLAALCRGAALHHLDGRTGVKDFDVYTAAAARLDRHRPPVPLTEAQTSLRTTTIAAAHLRAQSSAVTNAGLFERVCHPCRCTMTW